HSGDTAARSFGTKPPRRTVRACYEAPTGPRTLLTPLARRVLFTFKSEYPHMEESTRYAKNLSCLPSNHPFAILRSQFWPSDTVLDIGCGRGHVGSYLTETGIIVDGIEPEKARADIAQTRLRHVDVGSAGQDINGLADRYTACPFIDVLEHMA